MGQNDEASCQSNTKASRKEEPSYALIDSQSVKTTCYGENHGYDGEKNEGKKTVHCNRYDGKSPVYSRSCGKYSRYKGRRIHVNTFDEFHNIKIDISMQIKEQKGFQVLPKRWVVERTFAWLNGSRILSKDYETSCCSAETMIMISHAVTLLKRL